MSTARFEDADAIQLLVQADDLVNLLGEALLIEATRHGHALAVVGDGEVRVALFPGGFGHLSGGILAIARLGVGMQIALDVGERDQLWQPALLRGLDLAPALAQLGLDTRQIDRSEVLFLGAPGEPLVAFEDAVLVDLEALPHADPTHRDVVRLGAREVVEGRAVALHRHDADVDLQARAQAHRRAGRAVRDDLARLLVAHEPIHHLFRVGAGHEDVQVAHGLLAPAVAARDHRLLDASDPLQLIEERFGDLLDVEELHPGGNLGEASDLLRILSSIRSPERGSSRSSPSFAALARSSTVRTPSGS